MASAGNDGCIAQRARGEHSVMPSALLGSGGIGLMDVRERLQHRNPTAEGACPNVHTFVSIHNLLVWSLGSTPVLVVPTSNLLCGEPCQC